MKIETWLGQANHDWETHIDTMDYILGNSPLYQEEMREFFATNPHEYENYRANGGELITL